MKKHIKHHVKKHLPTFVQAWHMKVRFPLFRIIFIGLFVILALTAMVASYGYLTRSSSELAGIVARAEDEQVDLSVKSEDGEEKELSVRLKESSGSDDVWEVVVSGEEAKNSMFIGYFIDITPGCTGDGCVAEYSDFMGRSIWESTYGAESIRYTLNFNSHTDVESGVARLVGDSNDGCYDVGRGDHNCSGAPVSFNDLNILFKVRLTNNENEFSPTINDAYFYKVDQNNFTEFTKIRAHISSGREDEDEGEDPTPSPDEDGAGEEEGSEGASQDDENDEEEEEEEEEVTPSAAGMGQDELQMDVM